MVCYDACSDHPCSILVPFDLITHTPPLSNSSLFSGHGDSTDVPATTMERLLSSDTKDPALRSVKDTLSKQLEGMIKFREKVQAHKTEVLERKGRISVKCIE